jgi:GDP-L-fucose synthase
MHRISRIFVAGHGGLVGSAVVRHLSAAGHQPVLANRAALDLRQQESVHSFFERERPTEVVMAAARVGGIAANQARPADFIRDNLQIQTNVIDAAHRAGVRRFVFLGSSCAYPRASPQPIAEDALLTGALEPTNEAYAVAKIAGIKMVQAYRAQYGFPGVVLMPTNIYGPGDNFDLENAHVVPALMRKLHEAKLRGDPNVEVWGTGTPRRELLHVDDLASAIVHLLDRDIDAEIVNVGTGDDLSVREIAELLRAIVGYDGRLRFDTTRPDGTPQKRLDTRRMAALGWRPQISLRDGLAATYAWFRTREVEAAPRSVD